MTLDESKDLIPWHDLLLLLEGETVKLPAPKNICSEYIVISNDVAIFLISKISSKYRGPYNANDDRETVIMESSIFSTRAKKSVSIPKMFCIISSFWLYNYVTFTFTKISNTLPLATNMLPRRYHYNFWVKTGLMYVKQQVTTCYHNFLK